MCASIPFPIANPDSFSSSPSVRKKRTYGMMLEDSTPAPAKIVVTRTLVSMVIPSGAGQPRSSQPRIWRWPVRRNARMICTSVFIITRLMSGPARFPPRSRSLRGSHRPGYSPKQAFFLFCGIIVPSGNRSPAQKSLKGHISGHKTIPCFQREQGRLVQQAPVPYSPPVFRCSRSPP
jgi:hypothetical protein